VLLEKYQSHVVVRFEELVIRLQNAFKTTERLGMVALDSEEDLSESEVSFLV
jgi:hypothetical protein